MKIVCIGNSIVNGFPHRRSQCFASLWRQASGHEIINKGINGDVSPNIFARFESDVIAHRPTAVLILTGTNDRIMNICTPEETLDWLDQMNGLAKQHGIQVILMTPLLLDAAMAANHWIPNVNYSAVNEDLRRLRSILLDYGTKNGVRIIDAQEMFSKLYTAETVSDYLLDGLHPTLLGHEAIARFLPD